MWKAFLDTLPRGHATPEQDRRRRRRLPPTVLAGHIPVLAVLGGLLGHGLPALLAAVLVPTGCVLLGYQLRGRRWAAAAAVTLGLVWCSAALVTLSTGLVNPWWWALLHGVAVLAPCLGIVLTWQVVEDEPETTGPAQPAVDADADAAAERRTFTSDLLVNLARRNQGLLHRQLEIIKQLEQSERDQRALAELFTLDHLATRVRRNGENLLVLAGEQPSRMWSEPVGVREVLRAAIAETEDLDRVAFVADDGPAVAGHAVPDLTHLIAELTENAVHFSPPDSAVTVRVRPHRQQPGGLLVTVEDSGVGMPEPQLAAANAVLALPPEVDLALSPRLGLPVVARLAARHGITVSLGTTPAAGITATIVLPPALFAAGRLDRTASLSTATATPPPPPVPVPVPVPIIVDTPLTLSIPGRRRPEPVDAGSAPAADPRHALGRPVPDRALAATSSTAAAGRDGPWPGWWAADADPDSTNPDGTNPDGTDPGDQDSTQLVPSPRPRVVPPADPPVDPVTGLHKRTPQAHLAPGLRLPESALPGSESTAPPRPRTPAEPADEPSRHPVGPLAARTATGNEHGWMS